MVDAQRLEGGGGETGGGEGDVDRSGDECGLVFFSFSFFPRREEEEGEGEREGHTVSKETRGLTAQPLLVLEIVGFDLEDRKSREWIIDVVVVVGCGGEE